MLLRVSCSVSPLSFHCLRFAASFLPDHTSRSKLIQEIIRRYENKIRKFDSNKKRDEAKELISGVESIAAQNLIKSNKELCTRLYNLPTSAAGKTEGRGEKLGSQSSQSSFPLRVDDNPDAFVEKDSSNKVDRGQRTLDSVERGFFVHDDKFCDDYVTATSADMPEDNMTETPIQYFGNLEDAIEDIDFQLPGQESVPKNKSSGKKMGPEYVDSTSDIGDWMSNYGTTEVDDQNGTGIATSLADKCAGCGAQFHCHNPSLPGFVPLELIKEIKNNSNKLPVDQRTDFVCRRCYLLKEYNFLMNVNVSQVDYAKMMGHLRLVQEALVLLVVDMTDLQCSLHRELPKIIGANKPMIVVGNKLDLLPPDTRRGYLRHYRDSLRNAIQEAGFATNFNILKYMLVSAKTGFGIEELITNIHQNWIGPRGLLRDDIYLVGSTNAGKSTLFNAFIQSDLCKIRAMDLVERVTTSIWPGTTLSLLKFPLMNLTPHKLELRKRRLSAVNTWRKKEEQMRRSLFHQTKDPQYVVLQGHVGSTFKEVEEQRQSIAFEKTMKQMEGELPITDEDEELEEVKWNKMSLNERVFQRGRWCYDTPGTVNSQQILDLFTLDELINVIPRSIISPRIFILHPGKSLLLGGVARLDILDTSTPTKESVPLHATVFASQKLKINVMKTKYVDAFLSKCQGDPQLGAPIGDLNRLEKFPKLESENFEVDNECHSSEAGVADIVFSSLGWVLLTTNAHKVKVRAWTPSARGLQIRAPLLPFAADYRAKRIAGTDEYRILSLADIESFSSTQRRSRPDRRDKDGEAKSAGEEPAQFVNFDLA